jgi:hypothetical protein
MPVYSFITTVTAPNLEVAESAAAEMTISLEEAVTAGDLPHGTKAEKGKVIEGDAQETIDDLVSALAQKGFGDPDEPVNGGDCVDLIGEHYDALAMLAAQRFLPPRYAELRAQIEVGSRICSIEGETSDTDHGEQFTGENAIGVITAIDDDQEHGISLAFDPSGVSVLLSLGELADEDKYTIGTDD